MFNRINRTVQNKDAESQLCTRKQSPTFYKRKTYQRRPRREKKYGPWIGCKISFRLHLGFVHNLICKIN